MPQVEWIMKNCDVEIESFMKRRRPPVHIRDKLDLGWRRKGQSVVIFEIVPNSNRKGEIIENPVAKVTYVKSQGLWKIFWQRSDLKWHVYEPVPDVKSFKDFLKVVDEDKLCCFFG